VIIERSVIAGEVHEGRVPSDIPPGELAKPEEYKTSTPFKQRSVSLSNDIPSAVDPSDGHHMQQQTPPREKNLVNRAQQRKPNESVKPQAHSDRDGPDKQTAEEDEEHEASGEWKSVSSKRKPSTSPQISGSTVSNKQSKRQLKQVCHI
jgi:hypothetical protein